MIAALSVFTKGCVARLRARLGGRGFAKEVVLFHGGESGVRIGAADHAELVGIDAEFGFQLQAVLECGAGILEFQHRRLLQFSQVEIALVPTLEVGEFIVRRKERVRLAIALDLRHFVERLPAHPVLGVFAVDLLAGERLDDREHAPIAQIAVVRDREDLGSGFLFARGHPFPQVAGIGTAERWLGGERLDQAGLPSVVTENDVPVQVVAPGIRGPLVADESSEPARARSPRPPP